MNYWDIFLEEKMNRTVITKFSRKIIRSGLLLNFFVLVVVLGLTVSLVKDLEVRLLGSEEFGSIASLEDIGKYLGLYLSVLILVNGIVFVSLREVKLQDKFYYFLVILLLSFFYNAILLILGVLTLGLFDKLDPSARLFDVVLVNGLVFLIGITLTAQGMLRVLKKDKNLSRFADYKFMDMIKSIPFVCLFILIFFLALFSLVNSAVLYNQIIIVISVLIGIYSSSFLVFQLVKFKEI